MAELSCITTISEAWVAPDFCAYVLPVEVDQARSVLSVGTSDFLALERGSESVVYFFDTDGDELADSRQVVAGASALNHGLAVYDGYLYASSSSHVYRWPIQNGSFLESVGEQETVIENINADGMGGAPMGHRTRTLEFDDQGRLYVSVGSDGNIDPDSFRSRIRRFDWGNDTSLFPLDFVEGEVFADGLRNEVGLAFDTHGVLWGVENSADNLFRGDLGGDIHQDNPAEELNRFREEDIGKNWGYPQCWTEFLVPAPYGMGLGTVWAWPSFLESGAITDEECRANTIPPEVALQGHSAPLGITFYQWKPAAERPASCPPNVAFPRSMDGFAFIAYHGSWNRDIPTGYKVVYVEMDENGDPIGTSAYDLLMHEPPDARWDDGFRPVDVSFDDCGRLLISSDGSRGDGFQGSKIVRMENTAPPPADTIAPTDSDTVVPTSTASPLSDTVEPSSSGTISFSNEGVYDFSSTLTSAPTEDEAMVESVSRTDAGNPEDKTNDSASIVGSGAMEGALRWHSNLVAGAAVCLWILLA